MVSTSTCLLFGNYEYNNFINYFPAFHIATNHVRSYIFAINKIIYCSSTIYLVKNCNFLKRKRKWILVLKTSAMSLCSRLLQNFPVFPQIFYNILSQGYLGIFSGFFFCEILYSTYLYVPKIQIFGNFGWTMTKIGAIFK